MIMPVTDDEIRKIRKEAGCGRTEAMKILYREKLQRYAFERLGSSTPVSQNELATVVMSILAAL